VLAASDPSTFDRDERSHLLMELTCPNCGNERSFLAKTLQTHVVQSGGEELELTEQSRPAVFELLCDECETEIDFGALESDLRREMILLLGAH